MGLVWGLGVVVIGVGVGVVVGVVVGGIVLWVGRVVVGLILGGNGWGVFCFGGCLGVMVLMGVVVVVVVGEVSMVLSCLGVLLGILDDFLVWLNSFLKLLVVVGFLDNFFCSLFCFFFGLFGLGEIICLWVNFMLVMLVIWFLGLGGGVGVLWFLLLDICLIGWIFLGVFSFFFVVLGVFGVGVFVWGVIVVGVGIVIGVGWGCGVDLGGGWGGCLLLFVVGGVILLMLEVVLLLWLVLLFVK